MIQTVTVNGTNVTFDKEKTSFYQKENISGCTCEGCRNFHKTVKINKELSCFLAQFGIDCELTDEVFWYDMGKGEAFYYDSDGYYGVCGDFDGNEFSFEKYGVEIFFLKTAELPVEREDEHFYIRIKGNFPLVLDENERDNRRSCGFVKRIKAIFKSR